MPPKKQPTKTKPVNAQAVTLAEYAAKALVAAKKLHFKTNSPLDDEERVTVARLSALPEKIKKKLAKTDGSFTIAEVASMIMAMSESFYDAKPIPQVALIVIAKLMGCLQHYMPEVPATKSKELEYPFQHPAASEVGFIFHSLCRNVHTDSDYRALPRRDRFLWDVTFFENEVMNGGIDQFFCNSGGNHAAECLEALEAIKASRSFELLKRACALFPKRHPSTNQAVRRKQLLAFRRDDQDIDDMIDGDIEVDLYQLLLDYYNKADPKAT